MNSRVLYLEGVALGLLASLVLSQAGFYAVIAAAIVCSVGAAIERRRTPCNQKLHSRFYEKKES